MRRALVVTSFTAFLLAPAVGLCAAVPHPQRAEFNRAWQLAGEGRPDEAIPLLKQIIAKDKTFIDAYTTLVEAYRQKKELSEAEKYFRSLPGTSSNGLAFYGLGKVFHLRGQHGVAAENYTTCIRHSPDTCLCYEQLVKELEEAHPGGLSSENLGKRISLSPPGACSYAAIARIYELQLKLEDAIRAQQRALDLGRAGRDFELIGRMELLLSWSYGTYGDREPMALPHAQEALRTYQELNNLEMELKSTEAVGRSYLKMGDFAQAQIVLERNLALATKFRNHELLASTQAALGDYYSSKGNHESALEFFSKAETECQLIDFWCAHVLLRIGSVYEAQGDLTNARKTFQRYREQAAKHGDKWSEAFALRRLGDVYRDAGDYFKALQALTEAVREFREIGRLDNAGAGLRVMASVHSALGNYASAARYYGDSLRAAREIHDAEQQERIHLGLGEMHLRMADPRTALLHLRNALRLSEQTAYTQLRSRTLLHMGNAYRMLGDSHQALAALNNSLQIARQIHSKPYETQALIGLGELDLKAGDSASAEAHFRAGLEVAETLELVDAKLASRRGLGETFAIKRNYSESLQHLQLAVEAIESLRGRIPTPELRSDFVQQNWNVYEDTIHVLSRLHDENPANGFDRQALYYSERGRARSFLDLLAESRASILKGLDSTQRHRQASLLSELSKASAALLHDPSEANKQSVRQAEQELTRWALDLRLTNPQYQALQYPEPDDATSIQSALAGTGVTILEYSLGERRSHVWAISERQVRMARLPSRQEIEREVRSFRALASQPPKEGSLEACRDSSRRLYDLLVAPVGKTLLGVPKILVVPDGILHYLPFEALAKPSAPGLRYLIEDHTITYAPSASVFRELSAAKKGESRPRKFELLAYGDPPFGTTQARYSGSDAGAVVRGVYESSGVQFSALPNTRIEVNSIGGLYPKERRKICLGPNATEASVKREKLTDYTRLHFATHAVIDEEAPSRSGVVLSLVNTGNEDGILRAGEIFNLEIDADLVVLSACHTGLGKLVKGEGMVGLTRAFLYAGSRRVVVSLWKVNDLATAEFMKIFYQKMKAGRLPSLALKEAKLAMIHSDSPAYRNPYYWTPFVLVGTF